MKPKELKEFKLINSLLTLIIHNTNPDEEIELNMPLRSLTYSYVSELVIYISLMQWEIHSGYMLNPQKAIDLSIHEIVDRALMGKPLELEGYQNHVQLRMKEISYTQKLIDKEGDIILEDIDRKIYLNNKN